MGLEDPLLEGKTGGEASFSSSGSAQKPSVPEASAPGSGTKKKAKKKLLNELRKKLENHPAEVQVQELEAKHEELLKYKNRWLDAPILHFAVAVWPAKLVQRVLDRKAAVNSHATYAIVQKSGQAATRSTAKAGEGTPKQYVHLEAIHVAAGLGRTGAMEVLLKNNAKFNVYSQIREGDLDHGPSTSHDFYMPLHDAAWCGQKTTMRMLLEAKADAASDVNRDGKTALHLLVQAGHAGSGAIKEMLELLLNTDPEQRLKMLEATTKDDIMPADHRGLTPLELAVVGGQFPPQLMHLLIGSESAIEGMLSLARVSMSATEAFADQLDQRDQFEVLRGCQGEHAVDKLATLLFKAPSAAVRMLDLITVEPAIADPQHWPIPGSAIMTRAFGWSRVTMVCQYRSDHETRTYEDFHRGDRLFTNSNSNEKERTLLWPCWNFDSEHFSHPPWHQDLIRRVPEKSSPEDGVEDVCVKAVLLPGILDVDILWALARTRPKNYYIFARLAVKGVITCVWRGLVERVYLINLVWRSLEQLALVAWGFMTSSEAEAEEPPNQRAAFPLPLCWALLLAAVIRELGESIVWAMCHHQKKCQYAARRRCSQESFLLGEAAPSRKKSGMSLGETVQWRSLWSMRSLLFSADTGFFVHVLTSLSLLYLLLRHSGIRSWGLIYGEEQIHAASVALGFNVCLRFLALLHMLRVCTPLGRKIVTAGNSLLSLSMFEMAFTLCFIFSAIWCTFVIMVGREHRAGWVALYLYRGLIFGDGDGLENLGLSPDPEGGESEYHHMVMTFSMAAAGGLFQLVVLNLIVNPVYGSEYESIQQEADLVIQRQRAGYIVMYLMSKRPRHAIYQTLESFRQETVGDVLTLRQALSCVALFLLVSGFLLPLLLRNLLSVAFSALCLTTGQVLLNAAFMYSTWIGDIAAAGEEEEVVATQSALSMSSEESSRQAGPFLWICHRADYNERWCIANDPIDRGVIDKLSNTLETEMKSLRGEVAELKAMVQGDKKGAVPKKDDPAS